MTKNEFYKQWLEHFAVGIPPKDLKKYVVSGEKITIAASKQPVFKAGKAFKDAIK